MVRVRWIMLAGIAAFAVVFAQSPAPPAPAPAQASPAPVVEPAGPAPKIHFDATTLDLGTVTKGDEAQAEFVFKNDGDAPLKILSAKPG